MEGWMDGRMECVSVRVREYVCVSVCVCVGEAGMSLTFHVALWLGILLLEESRRRREHALLGLPCTSRFLVLGDGTERE